MNSICNIIMSSGRHYISSPTSNDEIESPNHLQACWFSVTLTAQLFYNTYLSSIPVSFFTGGLDRVQNLLQGNLKIIYFLYCKCRHLQRLITAFGQHEITTLINPSPKGKIVQTHAKKINDTLLKKNQKGS